MRLTRLRLSGFKSFADPTEIELADGLTGLVGPNGCGKSNIVEALRWVMGESSARGLRGSEMEDVVFAGSASRASFDVAEVTLWIEGPCGDIAGPGEQVELSRRIVRGVGSAFRLRGREVRARDVQNLFSDASTGARSAAIIGQGEIVRLVDVRADERRRLLEEAAGIGGLHARRREAESRLQATARNLELLEQRLSRLAEERTRLASQAREAERFRRLSAELRRLEMLRLLGHYRAIERVRSDLRGELAHIEAETARLAGRRAEIASTVEEGRIRLSRLLAERQRTAESLVRLEERLALAAKLAAERAREREDAQARLAAATEGEARERASLEDMRARLAALDGESAELTAALPRLLTEREEMARALAAVEAEWAGAEERRAALALEAARLEATLAQLREREAELGHRQRELAAQTDEEAEARLSARCQSLAEAASRLESQRREAAALLARLEGEQEELVAAREQAEAAVARAEAVLAAASEERHRQETWLAERRAAHVAAGEKLALVDRQLARLGERERRLEETRAELAADRQARELERARDALAGHEGEVAAARARLAEALREREACARRIAELEAICRVDETAAVRLESEIAALERLLPPTPGDALLHRLRLPEEQARAVAAVLGDDLLLGTDPAADSFWREDPSDPRHPGAELGPPFGLQPLAAGFELPAALRRALAPVALVDPERADGLQPHLLPGQALVSREGGLWRWDGLVRRPAATRETFRRLATEREIAEKREALAQLRTRMEELATRLSRLRVESREAAERAERARRGLEQAEAACAAGRSQVERLERDRAAARERLQAVEAEVAAIQRERAEAEGMRRDLLARQAELAVDAQAEAQLEAARAAEEAAREKREEANRELAAIVRRLRDLAAAIAAARSDRERLERELAVGRERAREAESERDRVRAMAVRRQEERLRLADELGRIGAERSRLEAEAGRIAAEQAAAAAARDRLREQQQALRQDWETLCARVREHSARLEQLAMERGHLVAAMASAQRRLEEAAAARVLASRTLARLAAETPAPDGEDSPAHERARLAARVDALSSELAKEEETIAEAERMLAALASELASLRERGAALRADLVRLAGESEGLAREIAERSGTTPAELLSRGGDELQRELEAVDPPSLDDCIARLKRARERMGAVNLRAARELAEVERQLADGQRAEGELREACERLRRAIARLEREGRERLRSVFVEVDRHFRALFAQLFGGGRAELRLTEPEDPFAAGLELVAMPPGKTLQHVSLLSGGEKSLAGLALVFAFFLARPSPLCVLDEVDAALDDANVERFLDVMEEVARTTQTRFLVVSHHPLTMARMDRLYGVTMLEKGVSRLVSVSLERALELRATA
ncbi:Chromosome partition protein Smc [bacterium HR40]|nr:Chromosome partition protein Smc [bacterium HR40]